MPDQPSAAPVPRVIRVFVSSTFRDMKEERDHLVKFVFPQLRNLCEHRGVVWGEVDLRWGVTDEEKAEGKVLPICLEEIRRCRPYFIGLLGERYGFIQEHIPPEIIDHDPWLKEHVQGRKSITELEILHGVLNDPRMADHAFFYFRDPAYVQTVPQGRRVDFVSENEERAAKLQDLKSRIRASGLPVRENYARPKALGELVLKDLTGVVDRLFPEGSQPDPLDRDAMDHAAYGGSRARVYIGRQAYFDRLDAHAADSSDQPLVVLGKSGGGKSALLANWAIRYRQAHPQTMVLEHYIGATPYSADWTAMLRRIMGEFRRRLGIEQEIPDTPDALRSAFANWLHMAAAKGRVVLILDALNQLEDRDGAPDLVWLPPVTPPNVRLIVSTLPGRPLDEISKRGWPTMEVNPLEGEERKRLVRDYLAQYAKSLSPARIGLIAGAPQSANPLYLRVLLDELRLFGEHERLDERIDRYLAARTIPELYHRIFSRWEADYEDDRPGLVLDAMTAVWAARRGLSEAELLEILGTKDGPLPRATWSPLYLAMSDALVSRGGLLTFAHDFLRQAARQTCLPTEDHQQEAHVRLADFFERRSPGPRRTDEFPWQLAEAGAWQRLFALLAGRGFFKAAWAHSPFEVKAYWARTEAASPLRMVQAYRAQVTHPEGETDKDLLWLLGFLLGDTGHPAEALAVRTSLVDHFRSTGDLANLPACLGNQAAVLQARGDLDGAMALHKEEERLCRELGNKDGLQACFGNQAVILHARGDLDGAMALHKEKERLCRELGNKAGLGRSLGNQALILKARGDLDGAMALHKEEERLCRELGNKDGLRISLGNQANILYARGDLDGAMALHKEEERVCRELGNKDGLQACFGNQALILQDRGDLDGAMALHKEEERLCRELGNKDGLGISLGSQALILKARGDLDGAMALHKEEERLCRELGNKYGLRACLGNQALILQARGDLDGAMALHKEEEPLCRELGRPEGLAISLANQASVLGQMGRAREGLPLAEEAYRLAAAHGLAPLAKQIKAILDDIRARL